MLMKKEAHFQDVWILSISG